jgi:hypothetical protein
MPSHVLGSTPASRVSKTLIPSTGKEARDGPCPWLTGNLRANERTKIAYSWSIGGLVFTEVPVGRDGPKDWPEGAKPRRIDGVRIASLGSERAPADIVAFSKRRDAKRFEQIVACAEVEVVEVKRALDRVVLGQVIIGSDLFELEYAPNKIDQVVVCEEGDPVLQMICERRGIKAWMPPKS